MFWSINIILCTFRITLVQNFKHILFNNSLHTSTFVQLPYFIYTFLHFFLSKISTHIFHVHTLPLFYEYFLSNEILWESNYHIRIWTKQSISLSKARDHYARAQTHNNANHHHHHQHLLHHLHLHPPRVWEHSWVEGRRARVANGDCQRTTTARLATSLALLLRWTGDWRTRNDAGDWLARITINQLINLDLGDLLAIRLFNPHTLSHYSMEKVTVRPLYFDHVQVLEELLMRLSFWPRTKQQLGQLVIVQLTLASLTIPLATVVFRTWMKASILVKSWLATWQNWITAWTHQRNKILTHELHVHI